MHDEEIFQIEKSSSYSELSLLSTLLSYEIVKLDRELCKSAEKKKRIPLTFPDPLYSGFM